MSVLKLALFLEHVNKIKTNLSPIKSWILQAGEKTHMLFTPAINALKRHYPDIKLIFTSVLVLQHGSNNV